MARAYRSKIISEKVTKYIEVYEGYAQVYNLLRDLSIWLSTVVEVIRCRLSCVLLSDGVSA